MSLFSRVDSRSKFSKSLKNILSKNSTGQIFLSFLLSLFFRRGGRTEKSIGCDAIFRGFFHSRSVVVARTRTLVRHISISRSVHFSFRFVASFYGVVDAGVCTLACRLIAGCYEEEYIDRNVVSGLRTRQFHRRLIGRPADVGLADATRGFATRTWSRSFVCSFPVATINSERIYVEFISTSRFVLR